MKLIFLIVYAYEWWWVHRNFAEIYQAVLRCNIYYMGLEFNYVRYI